MSSNEYAELITLRRYIYAELELVVNDEESGNHLLAKLWQLKTAV